MHIVHAITSSSLNFYFIKCTSGAAVSHTCPHTCVFHPVDNLLLRVVDNELRRVQDNDA